MLFVDSGRRENFACFISFHSFCGSVAGGNVAICAVSWCCLFTLYGVYVQEDSLEIVRPTL